MSNYTTLWEQIPLECGSLLPLWYLDCTKYQYLSQWFNDAIYSSLIF